MRKIKYSNWFKRSNKFVPFDFFSSDPEDWAKYISDPDCPPHFLSTAWHEIKQDMKELKRKWIDDKDYLYTEKDHRERNYWCNRISDTVVALAKNKSTPDDVAIEMTITNWGQYRDVCGELGLKFPTSSFRHFVLKKNKYESFPYLFDHFLSVINRDVDSNFPSHESDCVHALQSLHSLIRRFSLNEHVEGELIGDSDIFRKYIEKNQLRVMDSIDRYLDINYLSKNKQKSNVFIDNEEGITYAWRIIQNMCEGASGIVRKKRTDGSWTSITSPRFSLDNVVIKRGLAITQKMVNFIKDEPALSYILRPDRIDRPEKNLIYRYRIAYVRHLLGIE